MFQIEENYMWIKLTELSNVFWGVDKRSNCHLLAFRKKNYSFLTRKMASAPQFWCFMGQTLSVGVCNFTDTKVSL